MDESLNIPYFISGKFDIQGVPSLDTVRNFISKYNEIFKIDNPSLELTLVSDVIDDLGFQHIKVQRIHDNIPIYGSELIAHFDKKGQLYCINGRYHPSIDIDITPTVDVFNAIDITIQDLFSHTQLPFNSEEYYKYSTTVRDELVIYHHENSYYLAYKIDHPLTFIENNTHEWRFFVDAKTGEILSKYDNLKSDGPMLSSSLDVLNNQRTLNTYLLDGSYFMIDASKSMFQSINNADLYKSKGVVITVDYRTGSDRDPYYIIINPNNSNWDKVAVSAHCNLGETYLFVNNMFNRNSFGGNGESIRAHIHYEKNLVNAYWSDALQGFLFGDGDGVQSTYLAGAQDIITHEFTHGITSYTSNLEYAFQPGALNESFSDIIASVHDNDDWLIGEDVWTPDIPGDALRSMEDPNIYDQPKYMSQFYYLNRNQDSGGVHINSGIPNYAFYLFAKEIGREKAGQIAFRGFTLYLTKFSQFIDAREACIHAALDLYGKDSNEVLAVMNAFLTVGIGSGDLPVEDCVGIDEIEPNDFIDVNPQPISGENPIIVCGEINLGTNDGKQYTGDYDFYEITASSTGIMTASLNWGTKTSDLDLYLVDINLETLTGEAGATDRNPENIQFFLEKDKKYYLLAVSWHGKSKYKLTINVPEPEGWDCQGVNEIPEPNDWDWTEIAGQGILTACGNMFKGGYNYDTDEYTGDWDWFYYHLTEPGLVQFVVDWDSNADLDFIIGDNDGNLISGILGITIDKPEMITMKLDAGYYILSVVSFDEPANYKLTIRQPGFVTEGCDGFWETEPNDTIYQAEEVSGLNPIDICGNFDYPGNGEIYGDFDVYKLVPDISGVATFRLFYNADWIFNILVIRLYPTQYELIGFGEDKSEELSHIKMIKANVFKDAEYYVAVAPWYGASDYSIRIDIEGNEKADIQEVEPNNGLDTAQLIDGISPMIINGSITSFQNTNEIDLYKTKVITAEFGASMYAQADWTGNGNLDMYIIEVNGTTINFVSKNFGATKNNPEGVFVELPPGKEYYLGLIC
ncbi:M4 family metallopeptidase, partial [bacterium]|nr:M4 family metallopeptidase [bacterium]